MIKLNCDLGEGMPHDAQIIPRIDQANIACGFHAGSATQMRETILLAQQHGVEIGAHPSYPDREHFGRISMPLPASELTALVQYQVGALQALCRANGTALTYVKPHGALYNDMMQDIGLFETLVRAVAAYDASLDLMILSTTQNNTYTAIASRHGIKLLYEIFADRNYTDAGTLVPRNKPDAVIEDADQIVERIKQYQHEGLLYSLHGKALTLEGDSLCVHGDNTASLAIIKALRDAL
jgi:UPF0271 protein